jgi:phage terminase large subunit-like protein
VDDTQGGRVEDQGDPGRRHVLPPDGTLSQSQPADGADPGPPTPRSGPQATKRLGNSAKRLEDATAGPWEGWRGSRAARCIDFIERYCAAPRGRGFGKPLVLDHWQKDLVEQVLGPEVTQALVSIGKGNGKSVLAAGIVTWATFNDTETGAPVVPIVAVSQRMANTTIFGTALHMVATCDDLRRRSVVFSGAGQQRILVPRSGGEMLLLPSSPDATAGLDTTLGLADEVSYLPLESWEALALGCKREGSRVLGIGTPQPDRTDSALWAMRERWRLGKTSPGFRFIEYAADPGCDAGDEEQWAKANPGLSSGIVSLSQLRERHANTDEGRWRIFHLGQWASAGDGCWLGPRSREIWEGLEDADFEFDPLEPLYVGVDIGVSRDTSAVVSIQQDERGVWHAGARIWKPREGEVIDVRHVERYLLDLCGAYNVRAVGFDQRLFLRSATILAEDFDLPMQHVPQTETRMCAATQATLDLITQGKLAHLGHKEFSEQVLAAVARDKGETGFMLSKRRSSRPIDGCIALTMAVDVSLRVA